MTLRQANFEELADVAAEEGFAPADGILFDLGLSSYQLADSERAFSFRAEGPLDMRFDTSRGVPASDAHRRRSTKRSWVTFSVVTARNRMLAASPAPSSSSAAASRSRPARSSQMSWRARRPAPPRGRRRVHPATRVFQALRIAVNRELETLPVALAGGRRHARAPDGRLAVISYHSLEDRIVKRFIAAERRGCICPPEAAGVRVRPLSRASRRSGRSRAARRPRRSLATRARAALCCAPRVVWPHRAEGEGGTK